MAQLNVKLPGDQLEALQRYAARRRTPVAWLIKDYVDYLLGGGQPVVVSAVEEVGNQELFPLAQHGRALDWLADEPELYSAADGDAL